MLEQECIGHRGTVSLGLDTNYPIPTNRWLEAPLGGWEGRFGTRPWWLALLAGRGGGGLGGAMGGMGGGLLPPTGGRGTSKQLGVQSRCNPTVCTTPCPNTG